MAQRVQALLCAGASVEAAPNKEVRSLCSTSLAHEHMLLLRQFLLDIPASVRVGMRHFSTRTCYSVMRLLVAVIVWYGSEDYIHLRAQSAVCEDLLYTGTSIEAMPNNGVRMLIAQCAPAKQQLSQLG